MNCIYCHKKCETYLSLPYIVWYCFHPDKNISIEFYTARKVASSDLDIHEINIYFYVDTQFYILKINLIYNYFKVLSLPKWKEVIPDQKLIFIDINSIQTNLKSWLVLQ